MKTTFWLAVIVSVAAAVLLIRYVLRRHVERERASEARAAELLAQMAGAKLATAAPAPVATHAAPKTAAPNPGPGALEAQKLLFDAARKTGDAGEPAIALQIYGRLLARFPDSRFASEVRAAAEAQKKKLSKT